MTELVRALTVVSVVGTGTMAGLFLAFSTTVMASLRALPPPSGITAMTTINVRIVNPVFLLFFLGTGLGCLALVGTSAVDVPGRWWRLGGAALYLVGTVVLTAAVNIPLNNGLADVDPDGPQAGDAWQRFLTGWTPANHVRTLASLAAVTLLTLGLPPG